MNLKRRIDGSFHAALELAGIEPTQERVIALAALWVQAQRTFEPMLPEALAQWVAKHQPWRLE